MSQKLLLVCFEGLARLCRRVWRHFVRGSREISLVPSLHRASTDALINQHCVHLLPGGGNSVADGTGLVVVIEGNVV